MSVFNSDECKKECPEAGFSLVEVLVTLVLVSILAGLMLTSLSQFSRLREREDRLSKEAEFDRVADHIVQLIEQAQDLPISLGTGDERAVFIGSPTSSEFVAIARVGTRERALRKVIVYLASDKGETYLKQDIVLRRREQEDRSFQTFILSDEIEKIAFRYLKDDQDGETSWLNSWPDPLKLPAAVNVTIIGRHAKRLISVSKTALVSH